MLLSSLTRPIIFDIILGLFLTMPILRAFLMKQCASGLNCFGEKAHHNYSTPERYINKVCRIRKIARSVYVSTEAEVRSSEYNPKNLLLLSIVV